MSSACYKSNVTTGIASLDARLNAMTAHVRSFDSVVVIGSGMSAFAYPMTGQLPALVWQAVSDVDGAQEELARRAGTVGTPKEIPSWSQARSVLFRVDVGPQRWWGV
jgi:hypothetical protein